MRPIDAGKLHDVLCEHIKHNEEQGFSATEARLLLHMVDYTPPIEAEPVKHGRWIYKPIFPTDTEDSPTYHIGCLVCSVCGTSHANALLAGVWAEIMDGHTERGVLQEAVYAQTSINRIVWKLNEINNKGQEEQP